MDYFNTWERLRIKGIYPTFRRDLSKRAKAYQIVKTYQRSRDGKAYLIENGICPKFGRMTYNVFESLRGALNYYTNIQN